MGQDGFRRFVIISIKQLPLDDIINDFASKRAGSKRLETMMKP
jgi:hypothetical protein